MLRGGGGAVTTPIRSLTATASSALLVLNGAALILIPLTVMGDIYGIDIEEETMSTYLLRAIGAISIGAGVNVFLAIIGNLPAERAMGYALLPRLLLVLKSFLTGTFDKLGMQKRFLSFNTVVMCWSTFSLLTGMGNPLVAAKVFSSMAMLKAAFLILRTEAASKKYFGVDVGGDEKEKARALCRALGNELLTSAFLMSSLAFGMKPTNAAGYTSILWTVLLLDMGFVSKTWKVMGSPGPRAQVVHILLSVLFAVGFLA